MTFTIPAYIPPRLDTSIATLASLDGNAATLPLLDTLLAPAIYVSPAPETTFPDCCIFLAMKLT